MTYLKAQALFDTARNKTKGKPIGRNTRLIQVANNCYGIRFHNTTIMYIFKHNEYQYHTGGYYTVTTKQRMNQYGPIIIWSVKGQWYARYKDETIPYFDYLSTTEWEVSKPKTETDYLDNIRNNFQD